MSVKTMRRIPTIIVVGILFVGFWMVRPVLRSFFDQDGDGVVLLVEFEPSKRTGQPIRPGSTLTDAVTIMASMSKGPVVPKTPHTVSPWSQVVFPHKGETIDLYAEQFTGARLSCQIIYNGKPIARDGKSGPATIRCIKTFLP